MAGQLSLFAGRRQRGRKPKPPKEFTLHVDIARTLDRWISKGWVYTHLPFGESRGGTVEQRMITGARLKRMGTKRGWPDFILLAPGQVIGDRSGEGDAAYVGLAHFLEVKREGQGLSDEQLAFSEFCVLNGYRWAKVDTLPHALRVLAGWGAIRISTESV